MDTPINPIGNIKQPSKKEIKEITKYPNPNINVIIKKELSKTNNIKSSYKKMFGGKKEEKMFGVNLINPTKRQRGDKIGIAPKIGREKDFKFGISYLKSYDICMHCGSKKKLITSKCPKCHKY